MLHCESRASDKPLLNQQLASLNGLRRAVLVTTKATSSAPLDAFRERGGEGGWRRVAVIPATAVIPA
jgi:hypothetical protein